MESPVIMNLMSEANGDSSGEKWTTAPRQHSSELTCGADSGGRPDMIAGGEENQARDRLAFGRRSIVPRRFSSYSIFYEETGRWSRCASTSAVARRLIWSMLLSTAAANAWQWERKGPTIWVLTSAHLSFRQRFVAHRDTWKMSEACRGGFLFPECILLEKESRFVPIFSEQISPVCRMDICAGGK